MERFLGKYSSLFYALLRIIAGLMFAMHGAQKLFGVLGNRPPVPMASLLGVAGLIEVITGLLIAVGLFAGYAAFLASGQMAVAFFKAHFQADAPLPIQNQGELAVLYCFVFLYIASQGSGAWSLEGVIRKPGVAAR